MQVRTDDLTWRKVADDLVLLDLRRSSYLRLNPTGATLWDRLVEGADHATLVSALVTECGAAPEQADSDVHQFLDQLRRHGLLA